MDPVSLANYKTETAVKLDGSSLDIETLANRQGGKFELDPAALVRMQKSHELIVRAASGSQAVYGVTTALGPQVDTKLNDNEIAEFALQTVRGRAHALGPPLDKHLVRAAMIVRLNSLLSGASGASDALATHLLCCLNADLIPVVGETASIGAADLLWGGSMGLALIGEGYFVGHELPAARVLAEAGIAPLSLGPRDGLALASHSGFSTAIAANGQHAAMTLWRNAQLAAALTLEGFRGNLSPLEPGVLAARVQPGQQESATDISQLLHGSALNDYSNARRLQDPLSIRNIVQVHGTVYASLGLLADTITLELNGAGDNPVVLVEEKLIYSGGGYLNPHLGTLLVGLNHALVQMAALSVSRGARMMSNRFTDLPIGLGVGLRGQVGLGAVTKVTESLFGEIVQLAAPPAVYPPSQADNIEDCITNTALSAKSLLAIVDKLNLIISFEMLAAVHAIRLRGTEQQVAPGLLAVVDSIKELSPVLDHDRSVSAELESLADKLKLDEFASIRI